MPRPSSSAETFKTAATAELLTPKNVRLLRELDVYTAINDPRATGNRQKMMVTLGCSAQRGAHRVTTIK